MNCHTTNCMRVVPAAGHRYCADCFAIVLRTGRPPELPRFVPQWRQRLTNKDLTGSLKDVA